MEYTDSLDDLNSAKLAGYDCLVIYANWEKISPEQEKALLDFVERGGGFVPLHCASFCFLNSPKYVELVGAQFKSHSAGVFKETIVQPDNPVMKGLSPIESWDETYVHTRHNTNRVVLAERRDDKGAEPYTWVREQGKGRVFYTAWGHDERTWSNRGFQALVENGIRWASANSTTHLQPHAGLKPFEYVDAPAPLPNYVPNAQWGTQGDPIRTMQKPLDPEESLKHLVFPPDFEAKLFAAEPDIAKPIWLAWDERGRLWIAETFDYPNNMLSPEQGHDRIVICEDTKGQGKADKFTVFAEQLSVPTSFVFANGGVIVVHSGRTEYLKDTDGDGKADVRQVLFTGWGTNDTHAGPSNLHYGFDNWIWGTVGYSGFNGVVGGKAIRFSQGIFRFKPDGSRLEFVRASNNNTWGLGLTEDNLVLGSTANGNASMYMPIPNRYYEAVNGWSAARLETIADSQRFFPVTDKIRQVDWHGRYTAGAGSAIYTARNFPKEYWNRVQFVAEPTGHLLGQFYLEARGADFIARNARSFAASDDEWTAPICAEIGPDGALWMIDWYNYVVQHNPTPRGFQTGKGNAYDTPLRDKTHGRIYRIVYNQARAVPPMRLDKASPQELVATLKNDNLLWRLTAQRLLVLRGQKDVVPALLELIRDTSVDEIGLNVGAIHALWTLQGLDALPQNATDDAGRVIIGALKHPSAGVRRAAVMTLPRASGFADALLASSALRDSDAQVRLAALLALSEMPESATAGTEIFALLQEPRNAHDHWISDAATCAAARNDTGFLRAALAGQGSGPALSSETDQIVRRVTKHYAERGPVDSIVPTLAALKGASPELTTPILDGLVSGWPQGQAPALGEAEKNTLTALMQSLPESVRDRLLALAQAWGRADIFGTSIETITGALKKQIADSSIADEQRIAAAKRLLGLNGKAEIVELVLAQVNPLTPPALSGGLVEALTASRDADTGQSLTAHWLQLTPATRRIAIATLMRRAEWARALLDAVEKGAIGRNDLAPEQWSQLKLNPNRVVARRAERLAEAGGKISADRQEIVNKLLPLAKEKGDSAQGRQIFTANCAVCHTFNGQGGKVGPDLSGIGARDRTEILIDILDPNRSVEANYRLWNVTTKDGETFSGRLETETQTSVEILDVAGQKHVIERKKIATLEGTQLSIMPNGFEALPPESIKSLLDFLTQPHA
jgi:putative membrane-bound dehydrogenase-like protein